jgi:uncharacterized protein (DUF2062 family)
VRAWLRRRLIEPLLALLKQGITPEKLALSVAFGIGIGLVPILGVSTALCAAVALLFKLNMPAIQLINYALSPLQLLLIIPFVRLGEKLTGAAPFPITISGGLELLSQGVLRAIEVLWDAIVHAALAWILIAPIAIFLLYRLLLPVFRHQALSVAYDRINPN